MSVGSGFRIPLEKAGKGFEITHIVDQTVKRELKKVDFTKNTDEDICKVWRRIMDVLDKELTASKFSMGLESPAAYHCSKVYDKVEKAFENFKSQLTPKN